MDVINPPMHTNRNAEVLQLDTNAKEASVSSPCKMALLVTSQGSGLIKLKTSLRTWQFLAFCGLKMESLPTYIWPTGNNYSLFPMYTSVHTVLCRSLAAKENDVNIIFM